MINMVIIYGEECVKKCPLWYAMIWNIAIYHKGSLFVAEGRQVDVDLNFLIWIVVVGCC